MIPVNLVDDIKSVGFDYGLSAREVAKRVVAGQQVLWECNVVLDKEGTVANACKRGD